MGIRSTRREPGACYPRRDPRRKALAVPFDRCRAVAALSTALVAALLCLAPAASAQPDGTWSAPETIGSGSVAPVDLAVDAAGDAIAMWTAHDGGWWQLWAARRRAGEAAWQPAAMVLTTAVEIGEPHVAIDASGDAIAALVLKSSPDWTIQAVRLDASADPPTWSTAASLSDATCTGDTRHPDIAMNAAGDAVVVWECYDTVAASSWTQTARYTSATDTWATPSDLSIAGSGWSASAPSIAVNASGDAVAAWREQHLATVTVQAALLQGGTWLGPDDVAPSVGFSDGVARPVIDSTGRATVAWERTIGIDAAALHASSRAPGDVAWSSPDDVSSIVWNILDAPQLAVAADDSVVAVWDAYDARSDTFSIQASRRATPGGTWTEPRDIVTSAAADEALLAQSRAAIGLDGDGNARIVWTQGPYEGTPTTVATAVLDAAAGTWSAPAAIVTGRASEAEPLVGVATDGSAVAVWDDGSGNVVSSSFALSTEIPVDDGSGGGAVEKAARPTRIRWSSRASHGRLTIAPGQPLAASFPAAPGTTYRITARSLARRVITGTCVKRAAKVRCSIRLPHAGRWLVQITPRKGGVDGTPARIRVRVRAVAPRPEPITG